MEQYPKKLIGQSHEEGTGTIPIPFVPMIVTSLGLKRCITEIANYALKFPQFVDSFTEFSYVAC